MTGTTESKPFPNGILSQFKLNKIDIFLAIALILGFVFVLHGIYWGWSEEWNPDQMAFRNLFRRGALPFEPTNFQKPPLVTYFHYFLSVYPFQILEKVIQKFSGTVPDLQMTRLLWSRFLVILMFLGSIALVFRITDRFFGRFSARIVALVYATSAGFIVEAHYLTADTPLVFCMLIAFFFAQSIALQGNIRSYLLAGFFTGLATATKYNGLGLGIAILAAHLLIEKPRSWATWRAAILSKKLILGLAMIVVGFLFGNPFAIITFQKFIAWFWYNYKVTPVYDGTPATTHSYLKFFALFPEIIGFPVSIIFGIAFLFSFYFLLTAKDITSENTKKGILLLLSAFLLYYYKFGDFPRLEVRFVMPIVPFWMMISGALWQKLEKKQTLLVTGLTLLVVYNSIASFHVGSRFLEDSRMASRDWFKATVPAKSLIESTPYTVGWSEISGVNVKDVRMPNISGRRKLFLEIFKDDPWMLSMVTLKEGTEAQEKENLQWYTIEQLQQRNPDYVAIGSLYYERFTKDALKQQLYPTMQQFFNSLLQQSTSYKIAFDRSSAASPLWLYPREIDWVDNRIVILAKSPQ
ncbi:MAG: glycosyltransferase family 39 protein [Scytolyngbya sp. HA4215-MV1]|jgi:hypothetical protein|nr:glycosyltransferase family 39 protein [Scytolyngbya sp. HA4215-MV1]